jgi:hypothetical protein
MAVSSFDHAHESVDSQYAAKEAIACCTCDRLLSGTWLDRAASGLRVLDDGSAPGQVSLRPNALAGNRWIDVLAAFMKLACPAAFSGWFTAILAKVHADLFLLRHMHPLSRTLRSRILALVQDAGHVSDVAQKTGKGRQGSAQTEREDMAVTFEFKG